MAETGVSVDPDDNVLEALAERAASRGDEIALSLIDGGQITNVTSSQLFERARDLAAGLAAIGVEPGDRVAIFSHSCAEFTFLDYAIWHAGGVTVTIYETSSPEQVQWILSDSASVAVMVENAELAERVHSVQDELPSLRKVVQMDEGLGDLSSAGKDVDRNELDRRRKALTADSPATLVYTSGTTGRSKGCMLTHRNLIWTIRQVAAALPDLVGPKNRTLAFLPLAHILARVVELTAITTGVRVGFGGGAHSLLPDLAALKPTWLVVVPRVLEKVYDGVAKKAGTGFKRKVFDWASRVARHTAESQARGASPSLLDRLSAYAADALVFKSLRQAMGGELRYVISGGAPLHADLANFFSGAGIEVLEGYGLTETTGPSTINRPGHARGGTVGPPIPGAEVRIAASGEAEVRGGMVFGGYWQNEEASAEVFDEGWFRTGDIGEIDDHGHLCITGRLKDLIVTAGGKNVAPAPLEGKVTMHALVSHCVVVGDDLPFIAALVTLDPPALSQWASARAKTTGTPEALTSDLMDDPELQAEIQTAIDDANTLVSRAEAIRTFRILSEDFSIETGELTPTLKVKRKVVIERNAAAMETIYKR